MKLNSNKTARLLWLAVLAIALVAALVPFAVMADTGEPLPGSVTGVGTYTFYPTTALTSSGTAYSSAPYTYRGLDVTKVRDFNSADIFVTVDITPSAVLTVTPQFSADQSSWANAYYNTISGTTVTAQAYQVVLSADGTGYVRVPVVGEYLRLKMERSDTVTPTVKVSLRNN